MNDAGAVAFLARDVKHRWFHAGASTPVCLIQETHPGTWLVFVTDRKGIDRAVYMHRTSMIFDPHPDLHLEDA